MSRSGSSQENKDKVVPEALGKLTENTDTFLSTLRAISSKVDAQAQELEKTNQRMGTARSSW